MADPYRKLVVIQDEGPSLCIDCVHARTEWSKEYYHPADEEHANHFNHHLKFPDQWICVAFPDGRINYVTGNHDYEHLPRCKETNDDGKCEAFVRIEKSAALSQVKKAWWKFWKS